MFTSLVPALSTKDVQATIDFYTGKLGFTVANQLWDEQGVVTWAYLINGKAEIMLRLPNEHMDEQTPLLTGSLYLRTDNVVLLWDQLKDSTDIVYPLEDFDYNMREFAIRDCNGYVLNFGQSLDEVVKNV